jgi:hypothetical protein
MPPEKLRDLPDDVKEILRQIKTLDPQSKLQLGQSFQTAERLGADRLARAKGSSRPRNDDELHALIKEECGYDIPRVAVCPDHQAPFQFIADAYFERERALFQVGSREMGKTLSVSILHYLNCETRPGCTGCTFGAIEEQANRAYTHIKSFIHVVVRKPDGTLVKTLKPQIADTLRRKTTWKNGSEIEILIGTKSGVNSPHPCKVHADEVDLMEVEVWNESRNMASSSTVNGERIAAQDFGTSTLKSNNGLVASIIKECEEAEAAGHEAAWRIYRSCVFEAAQEVPNCQCADAAERRARLEELGQDPNSLCNCDRVVKGEWAEGVPRTLASVCKGKFFRSRGWMEHDDVVGKFRQNTLTVWDAQMECRRPMADGLYLPGWSRERFVVKRWQPRPEYGKCWTATDWGGGAESAVLWFQGPLVVPVEAASAGGRMVTVPKGAFVVFDELLKAGTGATKLADEVLAREVHWRRVAPGFRVTARFADMAGRQQRDDWREHNPPLKTVWWLSSRDFDPQVECLQDLVEDQLYWVDIERCSRHADDLEGWRQKGGKEVHDDSSHSCAAARYGLTNVVTRYRRNDHRRHTRSIDPAAAEREPGRIPMPAHVLPGAASAFESERQWRSQMGQFPDMTRGPGPWQR